MLGETALMRMNMSTPWGTLGVEANDHAITRLFLPGCHATASWAPATNSPASAAAAST